MRLKGGVFVSGTDADNATILQKFFKDRIQTHPGYDVADAIRYFSALKASKAKNKTKSLNKKKRKAGDLSAETVDDSGDEGGDGGDGDSGAAGPSKRRRVAGKNDGFTLARFDKQNPKPVTTNKGTGNADGDGAESSVLSDAPDSDEEEEFDLATFSWAVDEDNVLTDPEAIRWLEKELNVQTINEVTWSASDNLHGMAQRGQHTKLSKKQRFDAIVDICRRHQADWIPAEEKELPVEVAYNNRNEHKKKLALKAKLASGAADNSKNPPLKSSAKAGKSQGTGGKAKQSPRSQGTRGNNTKGRGSGTRKK